MFLFMDRKQRKRQLKMLKMMKRLRKDGKQFVEVKSQENEVSSSTSVTEAIKVAEEIAKEASNKAAKKAEEAVKMIIKEKAKEKAKKEEENLQRQKVSTELWKLMNEIQGKLYTRRKVVMVNGVITVSVPGQVEDVSPCIHRPSSPVSIALVGMKIAVQDQLLNLFQKM